MTKRNGTTLYDGGAGLVFLIVAGVILFAIPLYGLTQGVPPGKSYEFACQQTGGTWSNGPPGECRAPPRTQ